jgi:hypothetical protein
VEKIKHLPTDPHTKILLSAFDNQQFTNVFYPTRIYLAIRGSEVENYSEIVTVAL